MKTSNTDLDFAKKWYLKLCGDYLEVDRVYKSVKEKREDIINKLSIIKTHLINADINIEEVEKTANSLTESREAVREAKTWPDLIYDILRSQGQPMHYTEILKTLNIRGHIVSGKDPRNTILAYLSRQRKRFAKASEAGRGYYKLNE